MLLFKINIFRPAIGLAVPPLRSTILAPLAEAGMKWDLGSSFYLLAAAATTKSEPRKKSLGIGKRGARQPRDKKEVHMPQSCSEMHDRG